MLTEKLKEYVQLVRVKREADATLKELNKSIDALEREIVEQMIDSGMDSAKVDGMTVYRKRRVITKWSEGVDKQAVIAAMLDNGDGHLLGFNYQSLVAFAKEHVDEQTGEIELPEYLQGVLEVSEIAELGARNS